MILETFEKGLNTIFENNIILSNEISLIQKRIEPTILSNILEVKKRISIKELKDRIFNKIEINDLFFLELEFLGTKKPNQLIKKIIFINMDSSVKLSFNYYSILNQSNLSFESEKLQTIDISKNNHRSFSIHEEDKYIFFNQKGKIYTKDVKEMYYLKKILNNINNSYESLYEDLLLVDDLNIETDDLFKDIYKTLKTFFTYTNSLNKKV